MDAEAVRTRIRARLAEAGVAPDEDRIGALSQWLALHAKWSRVHNLTGAKETHTLIDLHLADCAAVAPLLPEGRALDVGSGSGLPGLVLALLEPERPWVLVDASEKRVRFLEQAALELGARNVQVVHGRIENLGAALDVDWVIARALAPLARLVEWTRALMDGGVPLFAMKGPGWRDEARDLPAGCEVSGQWSYALDGARRQRWLLRLVQREGDGS